jgi:hypothetical protein
MDRLVSQYARPSSDPLLTIDDEERPSVGSSAGLPKFELPGSLDVRPDPFLLRAIRAQSGTELSDCRVL